MTAGVRNGMAAIKHTLYFIVVRNLFSFWYHLAYAGTFEYRLQHKQALVAVEAFKNNIAVVLKVLIK